VIQTQGAAQRAIASAICLLAAVQIRRSDRSCAAPWGLDHYIQERARLLPIYASPYEDGIRSAPGENLLEKLRSNRRTLVLGEPGMGKSVALERLAWELARNDPPIVPVIIPLREYDGQPLVQWARLKLLRAMSCTAQDAAEAGRHRTLPAGDAVPLLSDAGWLE